MVDRLILLFVLHTCNYMHIYIFDCRAAVRAKVVTTCTRGRYPELESTNGAHSIGVFGKKKF